MKRMVDHGKPYVVALNFGYERKGDSLVLYFHSACEGRKNHAHFPGDYPA